MKKVSWSLLFLSMVLPGCTPRSDPPPPPQLFNTPAHYPVGINPTGIVLGDLNNDGNLDIVTVNFGSDDLSALLGNGDGTFRDQIRTTVGVQPKSIVLGRFDPDPFPDAAVINTSDADLVILAGEGNGNFRVTQRLDVDRKPTAITTGDFNNDGHLDIAVLVILDRAYIFTGDGKGRFSQTFSFDPGDTPTSLSSLDLNGDGTIDLLIANSGQMAPGITVYGGHGNGTFEKMSYDKTHLRPLVIVPGDYTGDGITDLVILYTSQSTLGLFVGRGDGTFENGTDAGGEGAPTSALIDDFDRDGIEDILITNTLFHKISISFGKGDGTFAYPPVSYSTGRGPFAVVSGQFSPETQKGLVVVNNVGNTVSVFIAREKIAARNP